VWWNTPMITEKRAAVTGTWAVHLTLMCERDWTGCSQLFSPEQ